MMMLWAWAGVPLGVYNIAEGFNVALRIQPQILTLLSLVTWIQCYYYERVSIRPPPACVHTGNLTPTGMDYSPLPHGCRAGCLCDGWS
jgi:hypothetical protein